LPAAEAEAAKQDAATHAATRRLGRFTVVEGSPGGRKSSITRSGNAKGRLSAALRMTGGCC
jgi:hypothetical protein